ncbi:F0F1 ATP synthase subunit epsilon [Aquimarina agarilytica]|uniref:F0F1 ATP synthase subunit epsilon n=1 Tax=Aquimarina agarilytica TaxID=1087449 RepID=UPI000287BA5A|nr:F0F1 ATP synthase subunit epsilon [Aquimarina agarilytica]
MFLEIVTPERIVFSAEVNSVAVPGINGEFQMLNSHAPVISLLTKGKVKIDANLDTETSDVLSKNTEDNRWVFDIKGGVIEVNNNKVIVLAD